MRVSATDEYGLRCLLQVAFHQGPRPMNTPEIARREALGPEHVGLLMQKLRLGGLVTSTRGAAGGYRLARPANEISVWEVISVVGGEFLPQEFCECHPGRRPDCVHVADCSIRALWRTVEASLRKVLQGITLADLHRDETSMVTWLSSPEASGVDRWN
ncbi:MAG: Rrf2 family transcriptional regulator [Gemmatimonadota bacterium]